jgi:RND family efflux transporter MFP subunit
MTRLIPLVCLMTLATTAQAVPTAGRDGFECLIEPNQKIELRSPVEALIDGIHVDRGSFVRTGQVLVSLDSGIEQAALSSARYRAIMEGEQKVAQARLQYARDKLRRREELSKQNFISAQERDDAYAEMRVAEAELIQAKDNTQLSALEHKRLEEVLRLRALKAPFTGVVMDRLQQPGELAFTGEGARPILKLAQIHPLRVEVVLPVSMYGRIKKGGKAWVIPEAPLKGGWPANVRVVDKVVDSASGTFGIRLELPNPKGDVPAGVKCRVKFD